MAPATQTYREEKKKEHRTLNIKCTQVKKLIIKAKKRKNFKKS